MTTLIDVKVDSLGRIVTGKTPSKNVAEYFDGEFQFVTPSDLDFKHYYCRTTETTVTEAAQSKHKNQFIPAGSIMFTCIGNTIGKCAIASDDCLTNQQINSVIPHDQNESKFIYYFLNHYMDVFRGIGLSGGAATPIINKTDFSKVILKAPDKLFWPEIGNLLSKYDDLIENNRRRIQLLEESARLLYQEWFVHLRFPSHEQVKITDGVPEGWEESTLGSLASVQSGYAFKSKDWLEAGNPVIKIKNITGDGTVDIADCQCVDDNVAEKAQKFKLEEGDFLIAMTGATVGKVGIMPRSNQPYYLNQRVGKFEFVGETSREFVFCLANTQHFRNQIENLAGGAAQPNISGKQIESIKVLRPSEKFLSFFSEQAHNLFEQRQLLVESNKKLAQARDLLLPKLMNGELAV